ncbi:MAG: metallophosphoesterase [Candidatus Sericytochromatia bacterium]|nr:metallophosphoesterase [Candidatus Sericytochromatia bacterium]
MKHKLSGFVAILMALLACAPDLSADSAIPGRLVAMGDLHGDLNATRRALQLAGAMDTANQWIGGNLQLVQTGDQLNRGDGEREILDLLANLAQQAERAGGKVHVLNVNHEIMNAQGDLRYVTPEGFRRFNDLPGLDLSQPTLAELPAFARACAAAFLPGGPYARRLAERPLILQLGENVFVHGGVLPEHVAYGIERLNRETQVWLAGQGPFPLLLNDQNSPIWTRVYSQPNQPVDCERLARTLEALKARRMIVGYTVQTDINSACEGQLWRIDTGMAAAYGGKVQVLEITPEQVRVLKAG